MTSRLYCGGEARLRRWRLRLVALELDSYLILSAMTPTSLILLATVCLLCFLPSVNAFGAGEIPDFAYLNGLTMATFLLINET